MSGIESISSGGAARLQALPQAAQQPPSAPVRGQSGAEAARVRSAARGDRDSDADDKGGLAPTVTNQAASAGERVDVLA